MEILQTLAVILGAIATMFGALLAYWNTQQRQRIIELDKRQKHAEQEAKDRAEARRLEREQDLKEREEDRVAATFYRQQFVEQSALFKTLQIEKNELAAEFNLLKQKQADAVRDFDISEAARMALGKRLEKTEADLVERQRDISGLQANLSTATHTISDMNVQIAAMRAQHDDDLKAVNETAASKLAEMQQQITALQDVRKTDQQQIADLQDENHRAQERISELTSKNNALQDEIAVLRGQIAAINTPPEPPTPPSPILVVNPTTGDIEKKDAA